jgi:hypothetical protein
MAYAHGGYATLPTTNSSVHKAGKARQVSGFVAASNSY